MLLEEQNEGYLNNNHSLEIHKLSEWAMSFAMNYVEGRGQTPFFDAGLHLTSQETLWEHTRKLLGKPPFCLQLLVVVSPQPTAVPHRYIYQQHWGYLLRWVSLRKNHLCQAAPKISPLLEEITFRHHREGTCTGPIKSWQLSSKKMARKVSGYLETLTETPNLIDYGFKTPEDFTCAHRWMSSGRTFPRTKTSD